MQFLVLNCSLNLLLIFCPFESKADVFARIVWDQIIVSPVKPGTGREWTLNVFCCWCTCYLSFWAAKSFDKFYAHLKVFFDLLDGICWLKKLPLHQFLTVTDWKGSRPPSFRGPQVYSSKSHISWYSFVPRLLLVGCIKNFLRPCAACFNTTNDHSRFQYVFRLVKKSHLTSLTKNI